MNIVVHAEVANGGEKPDPQVETLVQQRSEQILKQLTAKKGRRLPADRVLEPRRNRGGFGPPS